ncbi:hypothetical protein ACRCD5_05860 [Campylobacter taeniopygiae]|uniref:hypothetical protein n=1 Tax=Campylobacter taeniopygiae TaxID=2510188 RepID=UPI003D6C0DDF
MYPLLDFGQCSNEIDKINLAYNVFIRDFVDSKCFLSNILIESKTTQKIKVYNFEFNETFWHIISRKNNNQRCFDALRAERIGWIKCIIMDYNKPYIKMFYFYEKNHKIRLYLWLEQYDFVVILERIISNSKEAYIVTSFYIDNQKKER